MVPTATPHVLSHPSSWLLSSVKVMDGLCSAALGTEEALIPLWSGERWGPQPCPAVPVVVRGYCQHQGGSADAAALDLVPITPQGCWRMLQLGCSKCAQLQAQGPQDLEWGGTEELQGGSTKCRLARGPLAPKMPLEGGTSEGDTRAWLSSQKAAEAFISSTSSERQGCTKPRAGAQPRGERRGRCPPITSLLPTPAASAPSQAPRSCHSPGIAARGRPVHPAPVGWPAANGYMRVLEELRVPPWLPMLHKAKPDAPSPCSAPRWGFGDKEGAHGRSHDAGCLWHLPGGFSAACGPRNDVELGTPGRRVRTQGAQGSFALGGLLAHAICWLISDNSNELGSQPWTRVRAPTRATEVLPFLLPQFPQAAPGSAHSPCQHRVGTSPSPTQGLPAAPHTAASPKAATLGNPTPKAGIPSQIWGCSQRGGSLTPDWCSPHPAPSPE